MDEQRIKGLIITHQHLDHIRGAAKIISDGVFLFDYLLMNFDYKHDTNAVANFLKAVKAKKSVTCVNINNPCEIVEGDTRICFKNPNSLTRNADDINDSSIVMCVRYGSNYMYLTGDASHSILQNTLQCKSLKFATDKVLKVSHHGSRTGTNDSLINLIDPNYAFISAGTSRRYIHPHEECMLALQRKPRKVIVSNEHHHTIEYRCTGTQIIRKKI
jgi:beta-lactamase superfamily II metal-dependent hydrolase